MDMKYDNQYDVDGLYFKVKDLPPGAARGKYKMVTNTIHKGKVGEIIIDTINDELIGIEVILPEK